MSLAVDSWLQLAGFAELRELFRAHDIDAALLPDLTDADLKAIGIASLGQRKKLLAAITNLASVPASATAPIDTAPPTGRARLDRSPATSRNSGCYASAGVRQWRARVSSCY